MCDSLWLDETLAYWTASGSFEDTISRTLTYQGQSPLYYVLLWLVSSLGPQQEFFLRLTAFLPAVGAVYFLFHIAEELFDRRVAIATSVLFIGLDGGIFSGTNLRPYGCGVFFAVASLHYLLQWLTRGRRRDQVLFICTASLLVYAHYLYGLCYLVYPCVILACRGPALPRARSLMLTALLLLLSLLPLGAPFIAIANRAHQLGILDSPPLSSLFLVWFRITVPSLLIMACLYAQSVTDARLELRQVGRELLSGKKWWLLVWYFAPGFCLYMGAYYTGSISLFRDHYLFYTEPAAALIMGAVVGRMTPESGYRAALAFFTLFLLIAEPFRPIVTEDWRAAVAHMKGRRDADTPILLYSGLIESSDISFLENESHYEYLSAPLRYYYPLVEPCVVLLPYSPYGAKSEAYWARSIESQIAQKEHVIALGSDSISFAGTPVSSIYADRLLESGFALKHKQFFKNVWVLEFSRPAPPA